MKKIALNKSQEAKRDVKNEKDKTLTRIKNRFTKRFFLLILKIVSAKISILFFRKNGYVSKKRRY